MGEWQPIWWWLIQLKTRFGYCANTGGAEYCRGSFAAKVDFATGS